MTFAARDFWARQGASDAHTRQRSVRSEQRRMVQKEPPPGGLRRFSVLASLLLGHSPTAGDAPSSRLARTEKRCNKRHRIHELEYLVRACPKIFCPRSSRHQSALIFERFSSVRADSRPVLQGLAQTPFRRSSRCESAQTSVISKGLSGLTSGMCLAR